MIDLNSFNSLVKKNKKKKRSWHHGLEGSWWKGMSENDVRQKLVETNTAFDVENKLGVEKEKEKEEEERKKEMKIAVCCMIRNEERFGNLKRFLTFCTQLEGHYKNLVYIFIEGDSYDNTYGVLKEWLRKENSRGEKRDFILKKFDKGYGKFPKNRDTRRTKYFAEIRNMLIDYVLEISDISLVFMVDASYGMKKNIFDELIRTLRKDSADIVAPLNLSHKDHSGKMMFYDIFAYRKDGKEFKNYYPYHNGIEKELKSGKSVRIDSCGGAYLVKREVFDNGVRYNGNKDCEHFGFCERARKKGFVIKLNPKAIVRKGADVD